MVLLPLLNVLIPYIVCNQRWINYPFYNSTRQMEVRWLSCVQRSEKCVVLATPGVWCLGTGPTTLTLTASSLGRLVLLIIQGPPSSVVLVSSESPTWRVDSTTSTCLATQRNRTALQNTMFPQAFRRQSNGAGNSDECYFDFWVLFVRSLRNTLKHKVTLARAPFLLSGKHLHSAVWYLPRVAREKSIGAIMPWLFHL